jgi:5'-nucleotidase
MALIGCDLDGIIADLHGHWIQWYNNKWHDNLRKEDLRWELKSVVKRSCGDHIYDYLKLTDVYNYIQPHDGAIAGVKRLIDAGHDVVIITHAAGGCQTIPNKYDWIEKHLPFELDIIPTHRKELIRLDYLIDDSPTQIVPYRKAWPKAQIITIAWPYNRNCKKLVNLRAKSYRDMPHAWLEITDYIAKHEGRK